MSEPKEELDAGRIFATNGRGRVIGCEGEVLDVVESTMDAARLRALGGAPDGHVLLAEEQRSGRGRKGSWECPARQGLLMSVILRIGMRLAERKLIVLMGSVAAAEAAQSYCPAVHIKWPNDIVVAEKGKRLKLRKLGGVLVEQAARGDAVPAHVLGIGLNVSQDQRHLPGDTPIPATSLKIELAGRIVDRSELCVRVLERLDWWYRKLRLGHAEALLARWRTLSCLLGETVRADLLGEILQGKVLGLRATGELILRTAVGDDILLSSAKATLLFD